MTNSGRSADTGWIWQAIEHLMVACFLLTLLVMFIQVTSRYALGVAVPWTDEASRFSFIVAVFLGAAVCQRHGRHIRVTMVIDAMPRRWRNRFEAVGDLLVILISLALIVGAVEMALSTINVRAATLPVPFWWLYAIQGAALVLVVASSARDLLSRIRSATAEIAS